MLEEKEEQRGFRVTDKRLSFKSDEEKQKIIELEESREKTGAKTDESLLNQQSKASLPEVSFSSLVFSLGTQAIIQLGAVEDPLTKKKEQNLPQAKQTIDILSTLKEKTEGNLTKEEQTLLDNLLYDLRMRFVNFSK